MSLLIKDQKVVTDEDVRSVSLEEFLAASEKPDAVWIDSHEEVESIREFVPVLGFIALNFPVFSDGRAYSAANLLRRQYGFTGELRAIGDVRIDQLEQMTRCGFNSFKLADGQNAERALEKLKGFSFSYQPAFNREPLFRQRS